MPKRCLASFLRLLCCSFYNHALISTSLAGGAWDANQIIMCHLCNLAYRQEGGFMAHVGGYNESSDWLCAYCPMLLTQRYHRSHHHIWNHGINDDKDAMFLLLPAQTLEWLQSESSSSTPKLSNKLKLGNPRDTNDFKHVSCLDCDAS